MSKTSHIIWDWNGTLVNDAPLMCDILNSMLVKRSLHPITFAFFQSIYGHPLQGLYEKSGFTLTEEPLEALALEWHEQYFEQSRQIVLHHDARSSLEYFQEQGTTQMVLSALVHELLVESVAHHALGDFFLEVQGLQDRLARSKLVNAELLMQRIGADPVYTVLIGDSGHDAEVAAGLGVGCILVDRGCESRERLQQYGVKVCQNFEEVMRYLE